MEKDMLTNVMMVETKTEMAAVLIVKLNKDLHAEVDRHQLETAVQMPFQVRSH